MTKSSLIPRVTPKQLRIAKIYYEIEQRTRVSPTLSEVAREVGVSKVTVYECVRALVRKGVLLQSTRHATRGYSYNYECGLIDHIDIPGEHKILLEEARCQVEAIEYHANGQLWADNLAKRWREILKKIDRARKSG